MKIKQAAQAALLQLEYEVTSRDSPPPKQLADTIDALRAALAAEPERVERVMKLADEIAHRSLLIGRTQAKKAMGAYGRDDANFEAAMHQSNDTDRAAMLAELKGE